ncbi:hypothetical protein SAMN03159341_110177 [Paenibacillus sp. 1_12]|uniref:hypothetical protein n=1 Tax=Paenibacillus sp. 1_12 TaxID=1566278 RepID=UPI0008E5FFBF|nr:hypothetical protein [Paenibacillus sp. 1_12]SFL83799.1 hypothetical protein SAMN03159341_110177 [Paenibacillus sp. 1_12]
MQPLFTADIVDPLIQRIENYNRLLKLIDLKCLEEGSCTLPLKVMANFLDVTHADISKWINKLIDFGIIEQVGSNHVYKRKSSEIDNPSLNRLIDLLRLFKDSPNLSFSLQAKALDISITELEYLFGMLIQIIES